MLAEMTSWKQPIFEERPPKNARSQEKLKVMYEKHPNYSHEVHQRINFFLGIPACGRLQPWFSSSLKNLLDLQGMLRV